MSFRHVLNEFNAFTSLLIPSQSSTTSGKTSWFLSAVHNFSSMICTSILKLDIGHPHVIQCSWQLTAGCPVQFGTREAYVWCASAVVTSILSSCIENGFWNLSWGKPVASSAVTMRLFMSVDLCTLTIAFCLQASHCLDRNYTTPQASQNWDFLQL